MRPRHAPRRLGRRGAGWHDRALRSERGGGGRLHLGQGHASLRGPLDSGDLQGRERRRGRRRQHPRERQRLSPHEARGFRRELHRGLGRRDRRRRRQPVRNGEPERRGDQAALRDPGLAVQPFGRGRRVRNRPVMDGGVKVLLRLVIVAGLVALGGCAVTTFNHASNVPTAPDGSGEIVPPRDIAGSNAIALSFSGGGMRAAAFAHGVLLALAQTTTDEGDLLDDVTFISSVSGGSLTAAYFGLHGREGLARFRHDVLARDLESSMRGLPFLPSNFMRILGGGLNDNFAASLDTGIFHGATFADMFRRPKPDVWIQATDLYNRVAFVFTPLTFSLICSDLSRYSVAEAVAGSMAVPIVFAPVVLRTYPQTCRSSLPDSFLRVRYDPDAPMLERATEAAVRYYREQPTERFIKLGDGGLSDNLGVSTLLLARAFYGSPHAPLTDADALRIRPLLL